MGRGRRKSDVDAVNGVRGILGCEGGGPCASSTADIKDGRWGWEGDGGMCEGRAEGEKPDGVLRFCMVE